LGSGAERGENGWSGLRAKALCGDDAVVKYGDDSGLSAKEAERGGVVLREGGFDGGDAEVLIAPGEGCSGGEDAGFGVAGDGGVAIEDEIAVRSDAGGVDLGEESRRWKENEEDGGEGCRVACPPERIRVGG
jgi:hypothetical protein